MSAHWFWLMLAVAVMVWYAIVTVYVAIKGAFDIKHMLRKLKNDHAQKRVNP